MGWNPVQVIWNPSESRTKSGILPSNLESFGLIKVREFPNNSGYSNSVQLAVCSSRCCYKLVGLL